MTTALAWFRRDLRLHDNPMLSAAVAAGSATTLYVDDTYLLDRWSRAEKRLAFLSAALGSLERDLAAVGTLLERRGGEPAEEVVRASREAGATVVFAARDYSPYAVARDEAVRASLAGIGVELVLRDGLLACDPATVRTASGTPVQRFAAFKRKWLALPLPEPLPPPLGSTAGATSSRSSEAAARARLADWATAGLERYANDRDRLDLDASSHLSQDLRWGLLSPVDVLMRSGHAPAYASELCWRDFAYHVASNFGSAPPGPEPAWRDSTADFEAWREGLTGYPVVDAAMRQLHETGFMPNRARMIVASLLSKHLLIDWRRGAEHFMEHLIDGDWAVNRYNWQWVASVGVDASPYFRVMNPVTQSRKFDPAGDYVRRWLPELGTIAGPAVHEPWRLPMAQRPRHYPGPIVELSAGRERALAAFRAAWAR